MSDDESSLDLSDEDDKRVKKKPLVNKVNKKKQDIVIGNNDDSFGSCDSEETPVSKKSTTKVARNIKPAKAATSQNTKITIAKQNYSAIATASVATTSVTSITSTKSTANSSSFETSTSKVHAKNTNHDGDEDITRGSDIATESAAKSLVVKYFKQQNRPYSVIQLFENLHKRIQKPMLERCLNGLVEAGVLVCKEYGKAKIYFPEQSSFPVMTEPELEALSAEICRLEAALTRKGEQQKALMAQLNALSAEPPDDELDGVISELESRVTKKRSRRDAALLQVQADPLAFERAVREHNRTRVLWRDRRNVCNEFLSAVAEGLDKKLKTVIAEMGIETDQEAGVTLPLALLEPKSSTGGGGRGGGIRRPVYDDD